MSSFEFTDQWGSLVASFTLSVDHRSVDGAVGAEFLQAFKRYVERPLALLLNPASGTA